jgi:hypothetical protein
MTAIQLAVVTRAYAGFAVLASGAWEATTENSRAAAVTARRFTNPNRTRGIRDSVWSAATPAANAKTTNLSVRKNSQAGLMHSSPVARLLGRGSACLTHSKRFSDFDTTHRASRTLQVEFPQQEKVAPRTD